ncbi:MAG: hypothetical protein H6550_01715 [Chitinophagales bacterium]|nr:hypothetical protein [Chitinophagales bacterium]
MKSQSLAIAIMAFMVSVLFACKKQEKNISANNPNPPLRETSNYYHNVKSTAANTHNDYLEYMYTQFDNQSIGTDDNLNNFNAMLSSAQSYFNTHGYQINSGDWSSLTALISNWYGTSQNMVTYAESNIDNLGESGTAFIDYCNSLNALVTNEPQDFVSQTDDMLDDAIADNSLTDDQVEAFANIIGVAQGSYAYWSNTNNYDKWVDISNEPQAMSLWGAFIGADAAGVCAGACAGAVLGGVGAGPGAVCMGAIFSGAVAMSW